MYVKKINIAPSKVSPLQGVSLTNKNDFREVSNKRLKYCHKKSQAITNMEMFNVSHQFNDQKCFSTPKSSINISVMNNNTSNLLTKSKNDSQIKINESSQKVKEDLRMEESKNQEEPEFKIHSFRKHELNYVEFPSSKQLTGKRSRSFREKRQKQLEEASKQKSRKINPYTNQEYLYFRRKQKEKYQKTLDQLRKMEQLHNILKPCQIFQKQINDRSTTSRTQYKPKTAEFRRKQSLVRSRTTQPAKRDQIELQPWIIISNGQEDLL